MVRFFALGSVAANTSGSGSRLEKLKFFKSSKSPPWTKKKYPDKMMAEDPINIVMAITILRKRALERPSRFPPRALFEMEARRLFRPDISA
eukprot:CAMPEP_0168861130 /NCGR_PEP_ID=MMETSP0727-20121128/17757_1 /TAXON_ID=265536 /ORGANISM="Amphiprora sp., Strain CCMP467" /LENGTH=90 /DNA_ID=CAMNT_0008916121 /DNA_START=318 /DNA_END=590 /DNA_ORIENTATION=-